jgi:hypothetical protein
MNCADFDNRPLGPIPNPSVEGALTFNAPTLELLDPDVTGRASGLKIPDLDITLGHLAQVVTFWVVARTTLTIDAEDNAHTIVASSTVVPATANQAQQAFVNSPTASIRRIRITGSSSATYLFEVCAF